MNTFLYISVALAAVVATVAAAPLPEEADRTLYTDNGNVIVAWGKLHKYYIPLYLQCVLGRVELIVGFTDKNAANKVKQMRFGSVLLNPSATHARGPNTDMVGTISLEFT